MELEDVGDAQREAEDYAEHSDPVEVSQGVCLVVQQLCQRTIGRIYLRRSWLACARFILRSQPLTEVARSELFGERHCASSGSNSCSSMIVQESLQERCVKWCEPRRYSR